MPLTRFKLSSIADDGITTAKLDDTTGGLVLPGNQYVKVPVGTTAQRPSSPEIGNFRFNSNLNFLEQYTTDGWTAIASPPAISSVSPTIIDESGGGDVTITVSGSFFDSSAIISFITNGGASFNAATTTYVSASELTATLPRSSFSNANEPYDVKVTNGSGLAYTVENSISVDGVPAFTTTPGSLGTIDGYDTAADLTTSTIVATDPEGETVTFSVVSNSLPTGLTLGSNGVISGTASNPTNTGTSSFTVRADDGTGNTTDATFTITVNNVPPVYSLGDIFDQTTWTVTGAGVVASMSQANDWEINDNSSWNGDSGNNNSSATDIVGASSEFARHLTYYTGSNLDIGGMMIASGHNNGTDSLPAKDVAFYYSTDTTDGLNGTWTQITPKSFLAATTNKGGGSGGYNGQRTSQISANHVVLSGNTHNNGFYHSGNLANVYNRYGNPFDTILWDNVSAKGIRMDVRTKWSRGSYTNEKPHISMAFVVHGSSSRYSPHFSEISAGIDHIEDLTDTKFYIDPATTANGGSWDGTTLQDLSSNNFDYTPSTDNAGNAPTISTNNGGTMEWGNGAGSLRRTVNWTSFNNDVDGQSRTRAFTIGCWVKFSGVSSNQGVMYYGTTDPGNNRRHFFRTAFSGDDPRGIRCGDSYSGNDIWVDVPAENTSDSNAFITSFSGYADKFFLFVSSVDNAGIRRISWNGGHWIPYFANQLNYALNSMTSGAVGFGGDPHNDNYATHTFGPMFFHEGILPRENLLKEWNRHKTRFGW